MNSGGSVLLLRGLSLLDISVFVGYVVLLLATTWAFRRLKSFQDYALASKRFGFLLIAMSLAATFIGPGYSIGAAGRATSQGVLNYLILLPFCIQTVLVGVFVAPKLAQFSDCSTIGEVLSIRSGKTSQLLAGFFSVVTCVLFSAFLSKVAGTALEDLLGIPFHLAIILVMAITAAYTAIGGFAADVVTDAVQLVIMVLMIPLLLVVLILQPEFNWHTVLQSSIVDTKASYQSIGLGAVAAGALSFLLGETLIPPYVQRALAAPTPPLARRAFVLAGLFGVLWLAIVSAIGLVSVCFPNLPKDPDRIFLTLAARTMPPGLWGLLIAAVASILMSSQDSVLNSGAVSLVRDVLRPLGFTPAAVELRWARIFTIVIAACGAVISGWLPSIIDSLFLIYSLWAPSVLVPLLLTLFTSRPAGRATWLAMLAGAGCSASAHLIPALGQSWPIVPGILASVLVFWISRLIFPQPEDTKRASNV